MFLWRSIPYLIVVLIPSKGRRKRPEAVEGLESFDTLEGDSKVQSQFKFPTGKGKNIKVLS